MIFFGGGGEVGAWEHLFKAGCLFEVGLQFE